MVEQYRGLGQVEEMFRICDRDLQIQPAFQWTESRIHVHVAIFFMTLMPVRRLQLNELPSMAEAPMGWIKESSGFRRLSLRSLAEA